MVRPLYFCSLPSGPGWSSIAAVEDTIVVRLPRHDWALCAIGDLQAEGLRATLLDGPDCDGQWPLEVTGPAKTIAIMRYEMNVDANRICWESFVNSLALV